MQALFNQDDGTGRIVNLSASGLLEAGGFLARWLAKVPNELSGEVQLTVPGTPIRSRLGTMTSNRLAYSIANCRFSQPPRVLRTVNRD